MAAMSDKAIIKKLRGAVREAWPPTILFFEWAARQSISVKETAIESLQADLKISKGDVSDLVLGIQEAEIGLRIVGRHGAKSRIKWRFSLSSISNAAMGRSETLQALEPGSLVNNARSSNDVEHTFQLRPGYRFKFLLPADLADHEAGRLAKFVLTLPYGQYNEK